MAGLVASGLQFFSSFLPLGGAAAVTLTCWKCYWLTRSQNKFQPGINFPPISALGVTQPEMFFYQAGFTITGLFLIATIFAFKYYMLPQLLAVLKEDTAERGSALASSAMRDGLFMAAGVIAQGLFTLEMKVSARSLIHWGGAMVFVMFAMRHCNAAVELYALALENEKISPLRWSYHLKKLCVSSPMWLFVIPIGWQMYVSARPEFAGPSLAQITSELMALSVRDLRQRLIDNGLKEMSDDKKELTVLLANHLHSRQSSAGMENGMGLMQWMIVGSFVVYFATYSFDLLWGFFSLPTIAPHED
jgi:hypothetical protein